MAGRSIPPQSRTARPRDAVFVRTLTVSGAVLPTDQVLYVDPTLGNVTATLPSPATGIPVGWRLAIVQTVAANNVLVAPGGGVSIGDGGAGVSLDFAASGFRAVTLVRISDTAWAIVASWARFAGTSGAGLVGILDAGGFYVGTTVEAALQELGGLNVDRVTDAGVAASALLLLALNPAGPETVTIGADVWTWNGGGNNPAVGGNAAASAANLVNSINNFGTQNVVADALVVGGIDAVRIRSADAPGGAVTAADPNIVLNEAMAGVGNQWNIAPAGGGAVNLNTLAGIARAKRPHTIARLPITADMLAATSRLVRIDLPFPPGRMIWSAYLASGARRLTANDTVAIDGDGVLITLAGGIAPDIQATDIVVVEAWA